jgi:hypothetical protein
MKDELVTDAALRRFLLGDVDDDERQRVERLFICDSEASKRILMAEDHLIEEYLENSLTTSDRDKFLVQYGHTAQQQRKLRIARSIKDYAVAEAMAQRATSANPKWRTFSSSLGLPNRMLAIPVAATLVIALVVAAFWVVRWNVAREQENNRRVAIERELSDLNAPSSLREVTPQTFLMVLPPVSVRSVQPETAVTPRSDIQVVELKLLWTQKEQYASYRAVVHQVGKTEQLTISNLQVETSGAGGRAVRVRLPAHLLIRGLYQVTLIGITSNGSPDQSEEYSFTVGG